MAEKEALLTVAEGARVLGVARSRMYELLRLNLVPGKVQLGRQIRINPEVLRIFLDRGGKGLNREPRSRSEGVELDRPLRRLPVNEKSNECQV